MRRQIEGSQAVARSVALCRPEVISAHPISPQTHIVEALSDLVRSGGNCFKCDNCLAVCHDNAVLKLDGAGRAYAIDYDCKGCGIYAAKCPCGAIEMVAEDV